MFYRLRDKENKINPKIALCVALSIVLLAWCVIFRYNLIKVNNILVAMIIIAVNCVFCYMVYVLNTLLVCNVAFEKVATKKQVLISLSIITFILAVVSNHVRLILKMDIVYKITNAMLIVVDLSPLIMRIKEIITTKGNNEGNISND